MAVANIQIPDFEKYSKSGYLKNAAATAARHGGRYRVRAGKCKVIEGKPKIHRIVIIEFPSMESFESWYDSEEYAPWKKIRHQLSESELFVIEALSDEESEKIANPD